MAKPEWGTKRQCSKCGARFYDMGNEPIICPACGVEHVPEIILKSRAPQQVEEAPKPVKVAIKKTEDEIEDIEDDEEDIDIEDDDDVLGDVDDLDDDDDDTVDVGAAPEDED